ncbi:hypothetical protein GCM10008955_37280 [Deinococcus malanensis]|uniref:ArsR family transcriptional regulator n=1 Tax=Deinococcus malanensis TaxID=1706855 RepID=A0ABQ2F1G7_9DEIO|nr:hypothetical protein [Deinococcus malanensis]GGK40075.1 hypothetical protein GCM10008955_37280 [Deinococcus malanensis]
MSAPESPVTITDARAAAFLVNPCCRRFLEPFLDRECTVARAAAELGEDTNATLYRVKQMVRLGLLHAVREEPRRGRPVKIYRSVGARLFVPYTATPAVDLLEVLVQERHTHEKQFQTAMLEVMRRAHSEEGWGMLLYREGEGVYGYDTVSGQEPWHSLSPHEPAVLDYTLKTRPLTHTQAKALQRELLEVLARHSRAASGTDGAPYLVRLALAPLPPDPEVDR